MQLINVYCSQVCIGILIVNINVNISFNSVKYLSIYVSDTWDNSKCIWNGQIFYMHKAGWMKHLCAQTDFFFHNLLQFRIKWPHITEAY